MALSSNQAIHLISVPSDYGHGANDGAYYPVGLLTIASHLKRQNPAREVRVVDLHHNPEYLPKAPIVGISASSTLCYRNVLAVAEKAKAAGATVVLGGPHASFLAEQILNNRKRVVDYIIRNEGEISMDRLLTALEQGEALSTVPNLSWRERSGRILHNPIIGTPWRYDDFLPFDFGLLDSGLAPYWAATRARVDPGMAAGFVVFTHFGCGYRDRMSHKTHLDGRLAASCSYCSLGGTGPIRKGEDIVSEVLRLIEEARVPKRERVLLKCYGDNVGFHRGMLSDLARAIEQEPRWKEYCIDWTFYMQSSLVTEKTADLLLAVGAKRLFIGFDSVDDEVQRLNGLGTNMRAHKRAVSICQSRGLRIHGGFVLGCAGETRESIDKSIRFAAEIAATGTLERVNSAVLVVMPGAPAYELLCEKEPWIRELDLLDTEEIRWHWLRHFCPNLAGSPTEAREILQQAADRLDELCPGAHASMGYISKRMKAEAMRQLT